MIFFGWYIMFSQNGKSDWFKHAFTQIIRKYFNGNGMK